MTTIAMRFVKARQTVLKAIGDGRLPAEELEIAGGRRVWLIDPDDAEALWGQGVPATT